MKLPRVSIRTLMIVVGIASVDLAVARALYAHYLDALIGVSLSGLTLHYGVYRLFRSRGRGRAFWAGFVAAGLLAALSYAWATSYPKVSAVFVDRNTRGIATYLSPGAPLSGLWEGYSSIAIDGLECLPFGADIVNRSPERSGCDLCGHVDRLPAAIRDRRRGRSIVACHGRRPPSRHRSFREGTGAAWNTLRLPPVSGRTLMIVVGCTSASDFFAIKFG